MNIYYYKDLKKKIYRAHILSLGFTTTLGLKNKTVYDILEEEESQHLLDWIKPQ